MEGAKNLINIEWNKSLIPKNKINWLFKITKLYIYSEKHVVWKIACSVNKIKEMQPSQNLCRLEKNTFNNHNTCCQGSINHRVSNLGLTCRWYKELKVCEINIDLVHLWLHWS